MENILKNKMGDNFAFFVGVVECVKDPEQLGRAKIRVLGDHIQDLDEIPTDDLPWAMPIMPINSASMNGIGDSPTGIVHGSWVVGFYLDGNDRQQPVYFGTIGGIPVDEPDATIGFNDPGECWPSISRLDEPDTNRLARGTLGTYANEHKSVTIRRDNTFGPVYACSSKWEEPETPYAAEYPYNKVWEGPYNVECDACEWGHIEEWDSTPGAERYFRQHKTSQNFLEIHPDGKEVRKIYGDDFEIDLGAKHLYVRGDYKVTIDGNKDERIKGDYWQIIEGNYNQVIEGHVITNIKGSNVVTTDGDNIRRAKEHIYDICDSSMHRRSNRCFYDHSIGGNHHFYQVEFQFGRYDWIPGDFGGSALDWDEVPLETKLDWPGNPYKFEIEDIEPTSGTSATFSKDISLSCSDEIGTASTRTVDKYSKFPNVEISIPPNAISVASTNQFLHRNGWAVFTSTEFLVTGKPKTTQYEMWEIETSGIVILPQTLPNIDITFGGLKFDPTEITVTPIVPPSLFDCG